MSNLTLEEVEVLASEVLDKSNDIVDSRETIIVDIE